MVNAIVAGAAGRMGSKIVRIICESEGISLAGAFEHPENDSLNQDAGLPAGLGEIGVKISGSIKDVIDKADVLIDFTSPRATLENIRAVSSYGKSMVIGTTGITGDMLKEVEDLAKSIKCVFAPNMSVGVNVMFRIAGEMAKILGDDYDMEILETHHKLKKDAPSGTAMGLARVLADATGRNLEECGVYERKGIIGERKEGEIGIQALRAGDITGEHTVMFAGTGERLELTHRAHNRDNFARGAVRAAKWIVDKSVGLYDMQDVLGIK